MNITELSNYRLNDLDKINLVLGKNGSGKSTLLKEIDTNLSNDDRIGVIKYITPERGGSLSYDPNVERNMTNNSNWLVSSRRKNQFNQFKEQTMVQYRKLEILSLRRIEKNLELRQNLEYTFDNVIEKINALLDNIYLKRTDSDFSIFSKSSDEEIPSTSISSGEAELISLAIESLAFKEESIENKQNILLFDEPDLHLHPDLQMKFAKFLINLFKDRDIYYLIIATHSTSLIGGFSASPNTRLSFQKSNGKVLNFEPINESYKKVIPIFGAHPLSNVFNETPIFLVEGEDEIRIWQQAIRSSEGSLKLYPCSVDGIGNMNEFEAHSNEIIESVYDNAVGYSLRDGDGTTEELDDLSNFIRFRLNCRNSENLLLSDECLTSLEITFDDLVMRIEHWLEMSEDHPHFEVMNNFLESGFDRRNFDTKVIRNDLLGIIGSPKPWEIVVGQTIGMMRFDGENESSIVNYLGEKLYNHLLNV